jgi:hypothetical protein
MSGRSPDIRKAPFEALYGLNHGEKATHLPTAETSHGTGSVTTPEPREIAKVAPEGIRARLWRLVSTPIKIPGWLVAIWTVYTEIPDQQARIEYWIERSHNVPGLVAAVSTFLTSPYVNRPMLCAAILWIIFVGEPRTPTVRSPILRVVGWSIVGLYVLAFVVTLTAGYVMATYGPRHLEPWQKQIFVEKLPLPADRMVKASVAFEMGCSDCRRYAAEIFDAMKKAKGWENTYMTNSTLLFGPTFVLSKPVEIMTNEKTGTSPELLALMSAFEMADIKFQLNRDGAGPLSDISVRINPQENQ